MREMSRTEVDAFLTFSSRTLKVATVRPDGRPHVAPVWFVLDGEDLVFTTPSGSVKAANLRSARQVSVCVDDEVPPFAFVAASGTATLQHAPADLVDWTTRIAGRYLGVQAAAELGRRYAEIDDLLVRITIDSMVARTAITE